MADLSHSISPSDENLNQRPIGIFDSGIGGLTVFEKIKKQLPNEDLIYLGDTARVPYGSKSKEVICRFSLHNVLFLLEKKVKAIVVACNTASALALDFLRVYFQIPIIGVIEPGAKAAAQKSQNGQIGVIGTQATIRSQAYPQKLKNLDGNIKVFDQACPLFVGLVEQNWLDGPLVIPIIQKYLAPLIQNKIDTLVLGCTHYPLLAPAIGKVLGDQVAIIDSAYQVALYLQEVLTQNKLQSASQNNGQASFYSTDEPARMKELGSQFLGYELDKVHKVRVGDY